MPSRSSICFTSPLPSTSTVADAAHSRNRRADSAKPARSPTRTWRSARYAYIVARSYSVGTFATSAVARSTHHDGEVIALAPARRVVVGRVIAGRVVTGRVGDVGCGRPCDGGMKAPRATL